MPMLLLRKVQGHIFSTGPAGVTAVGKSMHNGAGAGREIQYASCDHKSKFVLSVCALIKTTMPRVR